MLGVLLLHKCLQFGLLLSRYERGEKRSHKHKEGGQQSRSWGCRWILGGWGTLLFWLPTVYSLREIRTNSVYNHTFT